VSPAVSRFAAVLARPAPDPVALPGIDPAELRLALLEDTYEVVAGLELVTSALALCPPDQPDVAALTWPGTPVLPIDAVGDPAQTRAVLDGCRTLGATEAAVVAPDAPDLPRLLLGKLFRALGSADVAVCPAEDGTLVALAARLPVAAWFPADVGLDTQDALAKLAAAVPSRRALGVSPGWHRVRSLTDLRLLDPNLEGWEATRLLLTKGGPSRRS
jgi:hypothetical protein